MFANVEIGVLQPERGTRRHPIVSLGGGTRDVSDDRDDARNPVQCVDQRGPPSSPFFSTRRGEAIVTIVTLVT
jgi:hypothetical protein